MLLEFSIENFLSFKEKTTFSMLPHESYKELLEGNVTHTGGSRVPRVLNSAVIFGPNASGKTNFVKALKFIDRKIGGPLDAKVDDTLLKFGFSKFYRSNPSIFSILFLTENKIFEYSFSIFNEIILHEKLECLENEPKRQRKLIFERSVEFENSIKYGSSLKGARQGIFEKTRPEVLYLRALYEWNNGSIKDAYEWFQEKFMIFDSDFSENIGAVITTTEFANESETTRKMKNLVKMADLGINGLRVDFNVDGYKDALTGMEELYKYDMVFSDNIPGINKDGKFLPILNVKYSHNAIDEKGDEILIELNPSQESLGTKKLFALSGPIIVFLQKGATFCIDELTSSMHPYLVRAIIDMFQDPKINTNGAQLIFNTHDVFFLNKKFFRRDQIWFASKNKYGATELTGLHDFDVRNDEALGAKYLMGAYGAIPIINHKDLYTFEGEDNEEEG